MQRVSLDGAYVSKMQSVNPMERETIFHILFATTIIFTKNDIPYPFLVSSAIQYSSILAAIIRHILSVLSVFDIQRTY